MKCLTAIQNVWFWKMQKDWYTMEIFSHPEILFLKMNHEDGQTVRVYLMMASLLVCICL